MSTATRASLEAQLVKNPPAMQETHAQSTGRGDPLEKEMTIHSSILACRIPWTREPGWLQSMGSKSLRGLCDFHFQMSTEHLDASGQA